MYMYIASYIAECDVYFHYIMQILGVRFTLSAVSTEAKQQDN